MKPVGNVSRDALKSLMIYNPRGDKHETCGKCVKGRAEKSRDKKESYVHCH